MTPFSSPGYSLCSVENCRLSSFISDASYTCFVINSFHQLGVLMNICFDFTASNETDSLPPAIQSSKLETVPTSVAEQEQESSE